MATLVTDDVRKYVRHITDVSSPKAEYVRHFEAITPRSLDGRYVFTSGSPPSHAFAEIEAQHSTKIEGSRNFLIGGNILARRFKRGTFVQIAACP